MPCGMSSWDFCDGLELVAEKSLVVTLSFPHVFSGNPLLPTFVDAR
jgi:hypothetical protein